MIDWADNAYHDKSLSDQSRSQIQKYWMKYEKKIDILKFQNLEKLIFSSPYKNCHNALKFQANILIFKCIFWELGHRSIFCIPSFSGELSKSKKPLIGGKGFKCNKAIIMFVEFDGDKNSILVHYFSASIWNSVPIPSVWRIAKVTYRLFNWLKKTLLMNFHEHYW